MLYYLDLCSDGDGEYGFGDGDGITCGEDPRPLYKNTHGDGITPYPHQAAPYPLDAIDLLTRLAATEALQPATTIGEHHGNG